MQIEKHGNFYAVSEEVMRDLLGRAGYQKELNIFIHAVRFVRAGKLPWNRAWDIAESQQSVIPEKDFIFIKLAKKRGQSRISLKVLNFFLGLTPLQRKKRYPLLAELWSELG